MTEVVRHLVATERALDKLGARHISAGEPAQLLNNRHAVVRNPRDRRKRRLLIGVTHGGRALTLVIKRTSDPTTWLVVTGWGSTASERAILRGKR